MSKTQRRIINRLERNINGLTKTAEEMSNRFDFINKPTDPEAYADWYASVRSYRNLDGDLTVARATLTRYRKWQKLPWWKRLFTRYT